MFGYFKINGPKLIQNFFVLNYFFLVSQSLIVKPDLNHEIEPKEV